MSFWDDITHFTPSEFDSPGKPGTGELMDEGLVRRLDEMRKRLGLPIRVNSGYRTFHHNREVGGKDTSSHRKGLAADISAIGSRNRFEILRLALQVGFPRIGVARSFIHLDVDETKPEDVVWLYNSPDELNR